MYRNELVFGLILVVVLLLVAGYFTWQQWLTWKRTRLEADLDEQDRYYLRGQVRRRLLGCILMVLFAVCLIGTWFLEPRFQELVNSPDTVVKTSTSQPHDEADKNFARLFLCYWIFTLLVFLAFLIVAGLDMRAVLREGVRKHRQLRDNQKTLLEEELRNFRRDKNGHV